jgi:hypothetical protein
MPAMSKEIMVPTSAPAIGRFVKGYHCEAIQAQRSSHLFDKQRPRRKRLQTAFAEPDGSSQPG